jgi:hypothetical protein
MTEKIAAFIIISFFAAVAAHPAGSEEHMNYSVVGIEYVGDSDKPIAPIVISDSKAGADWYRTAVLKRTELELTSVHVVSTPLTARLIADAETYRSIARQELENESKLSETVSITIVTPEGRSAFALTTQSGLSLLESLKKHCKGDESLHSDLSHFQKRILP